MRECLNCKAQYEFKREASKFCSPKCRVQYNRKHPKQTLTKLQIQVLYNQLSDALDKINSGAFLTPVKPQTSPPQPNPYFQPQSQNKPRISFEEYVEKKRECETEEDWVAVKAKILGDPNLSSRQKEMLIKYS